MSRKSLSGSGKTAKMEVRVPEETRAAIRELLEPGEKEAAFVRDAIEREIRRRLLRRHERIRLRLLRDFQPRRHRRRDVVRSRGSIVYPVAARHRLPLLIAGDSQRERQIQVAATLVFIYFHLELQK